MLTEAEHKLLVEFRERLQQRFDGRLRALRLFGSRARGDAEPDSDYDVLVVLDRVSWAERSAIIETAAELFMETEMEISPRIFDEARWEHLRRRERRIVQEVDEEGLPL